MKWVVGEPCPDFRIFNGGNKARMDIVNIAGEMGFCPLRIEAPFVSVVKKTDIEITMSVYIYKVFLVFNALIAFKTAITITPTSAKIATHMFAMPKAPRMRHANFMIRANPIFS